MFLIVAPLQDHERIPQHIPENEEEEEEYVLDEEGDFEGHDDSIYSSESDEDIEDKIYDINSVDENAAQSEKFSKSSTSWCSENGDIIMFEKSGMTVNDVAEMIVAYSVKFGTTQRGRKFLIEMIKICAGPQFKDLKLSNYKISKVLDPPIDKINYHFYCDICTKKEKLLYSCIKTGIKEQKVICDNCKNENAISLSNQNFFLSIDLQYQLQLLFQNKEVVDAFLLKNNDLIETSSEHVIRDTFDGILHKKTIELNPQTLTYNISTDGAPLFHVSKRGFWPLQIILNFLPLSIRFKYVLLTGVMVVRREPRPDLMNLFITEFRKQAIQLHFTGFKLRLNNN